MSGHATKFLLLLSVFTIATCGLIYELIASTLASYLLGDSVTQFSTVIGVYLFAMGIGSYLSKYVHRNLVSNFVRVEILIGLLGGFSAAILFFLFSHVASFRTILYSLIGLIGTFVGLEIPLLLRILKDKLEFKELVSKVFTFDYIGALLASLLFPLLLAPRLGLVRTSFLFGVLNVLVAVLALYLLRHEIPSLRALRTAAGTSLVLLTLGFIFSDKITNLSEASTYPDTVLFAKTSSYQRIVLTKSGATLRLHLNGNLQFSSADEYRYHEALVHPGLAALTRVPHVLILGGGDGMAAREVLKHPKVENITLVDLDPEMTRLFSTQEMLTRLNRNALLSPKVRIINQDAFSWLKSNTQLFDFVIIDFPDPSNFSLGKLYTTAFYQLVRHALDPDGFIVVQCTSPLVARKAFWCINATLKHVGLQTRPYHLYVPSFGEWGFILAGSKAYDPKKVVQLPPDLRFATVQGIQSMFEFPPDMAELSVEPNRLNNQILVRHFEEEWDAYLKTGPYQ